MIYRRFGKRMLDLAIAGPAVVVLSPLLMGLGLLVRLKLGSPVLFRQERLGLGNQIFTVRKFRSMTQERDHLGNLLPDAVRITPFGRFLRSTSLDELPQLKNVLEGSMSIVGPRPLLPRYLPRYTREQLRRHTVRPGITGLAQVSGRNALTWEQKFEKDLEYVDHMSYYLDLAIISRTVLMMLRRESIGQPGHVTPEEFFGTHLGDPPQSCE